ncbi:MAG: hypothetical protein R3B70_28830 [Polyangiaceae bacterium]
MAAISDAALGNLRLNEEAATFRGARGAAFVLPALTTPRWC